MSKIRIIAITVFSLLALGTLTPQFAQNAPTDEEKSNTDHAILLGFVRTINTAEVVNFTNYGSYAPWQILLAHYPAYFNKWLADIYSEGGNAHYGEMPEILPGWKLRLNVQADGRGYIVMLEGANDKGGYAAVSDERGVIRECKYLR